MHQAIVYIYIIVFNPLVRCSVSWNLHDPKDHRTYGYNPYTVKC